MNQNAFLSLAAEKPEIESSTGRVIGVEGIEEALVKIGQNLRVVEGLIVRLVCPITRGFPTPQVTWYLNDRQVKSSERFLIDSRSNSLIVNGIHLQDTGQVSCVASNGAGQATESSFISILGMTIFTYSVQKAWFKGIPSLSIFLLFALHPFSNKIQV